MLLQPSAGPAELPLETLAGWTPELATSRHLPCSASSLGPKAIGAIGELGLRMLDRACVLDARLTLFGRAETSQQRQAALRCALEEKFSFWRDV